MSDKRMEAVIEQLKTEQHKAVAKLAYALNILDLLLSLHALRHGAVELNPLMQCVPIMIAFKTVIVGALCWWLSKRTEPLARWGPWLCTAVYAAVDIWHIINIAACWAA